jgi:hypothetical protein
MQILINYLAFQAGWFAAVLGGANQLPWLGVAAAAAVVALHLHSANRPSRELQLIAIAALIGATWDSLLVTLGWLSYPSGTLITGMAPLWIVAMWIMFATTLNVSMRWLKQRWLLSALLGAVAGPLAFYGGHKLGGVEFADTWLALTALAVGWGLMMPLLVAFSERFDGIKQCDQLRQRYA